MKGVIFYYHPLSLTFTSAQTIQVMRDYLHLSRQGYEIHLYGFYDNAQDLDEIRRFIDGANIRIEHYKKGALSKVLSKLRFLLNAFQRQQRNKNVFFITRHFKKTREALSFRKLCGNLRVIQEFHEESFSYLFKKRIRKDDFFSRIDKLDGIIFTTPAQLELFERETGKQPDNYAILPNGVEIEKFQKAGKANNFVLTYLGQFNAWKNVELLFAALARLDERFTLRIAGGKNDDASRKTIEDLTEKYGVARERVMYLGFVRQEDVVEKVLNNSNVLLLPLGDNIQSRYLTSPMKLFEYMATRIPVLAVDYPTTRLLATNNEIYLADNDPQVFAEKIEVITADDTLEQRIKKMNRLAETFSYTNRSARFDSFLQTLRANPRKG